MFLGHPPDSGGSAATDPAANDEMLASKEAQIQLMGAMLKAREH